MDKVIWGNKFLTYSWVILSKISFELEFDLRTNILYCVHVGFKWCTISFVPRAIIVSVIHFAKYFAKWKSLSRWNISSTKKLWFLLRRQFTILAKEKEDLQIWHSNFNAVHNVYFVKYDVTVSFLAQVLDTVTYFVSHVFNTGYSDIFRHIL